MNSCDEGFKATSYLLEASKPPADGKRLPAVNIAFGFEKSVFEWMADQEWRGRRMGKAMQQLHRMANGNVVASKLQFRRLTLNLCLRS